MAQVGKLLTNSALSSATGGLSTVYGLMGNFMGFNNPGDPTYADATNKESLIRARLGQHIAGSPNRYATDAQIQSLLEQDPQYVKEQQIQIDRGNALGIGTGLSQQTVNYVNSFSNSRIPASINNIDQVYKNDSLKYETPVGGSPSQLAPGARSNYGSSSKNNQNTSSNSNLPTIIGGAALGLGGSLLSGLSNNGGGSMPNANGNYGSIQASPLGGSLGGGMNGGLFGSLSNLAKGGLGLYESSQIGKGTEAVANRADPFGASRGIYGNMLNTLMQGGDNALAKDPSYEAGMQAVQRAGAAQGFTGSGNMAVSLLNEGGNLFNQQAQLLSNLAGANFNPGTAAQLMQNGQTNGLNMLGQGVNSLQYGGSNLLNYLQQPSQGSQSSAVLGGGYGSNYGLSGGSPSGGFNYGAPGNSNSLGNSSFSDFSAANLFGGGY